MKFKMSDELLQCLLQNSSSSQLKTVLNDYLNTPECNRNVDFYSSLKSVLSSLQKHGEISHEVIWQIYHKFCLPILHQNFTERVVLYSVYELIVLCCEVGPQTVAQDILTMCFESLSSFTKDSTSPSGLPVVVSLDLVSYLLKDASKVVDEISRDKLFDSLLGCLCKSDELLCARISASILPLFLMGNTKATEVRLNKLWSAVKELTEMESYSTSNKLDNLQTYFATMCSLFDIFITNSYHQTSTILQDVKFWELLQQGLQQQDTLSSKRSMYLLKRALDHIEKGNLSLEVKRENGDVVFSWDPKMKKYWLDIWQEFVLLIETLSETQVHVIKPVLTRLSRIVTATEVNTNADSNPLHISWFTTIIHKASLHPNKFIRKWAVLEVLSLDLSKTTLLHTQNWGFLLGHFQSMLSEYGLYGRDHDGIPGTFSPVGTAMGSFFKNWFNYLPKELHAKFMSKLVATIEEQRFAAVPLACIFYALYNIPEMCLLGMESLQRIRTILIHQRTHAVTLRLATKGFILTTVANLTDPSLVSWDVIFNLLIMGRLDECLQRNTWLWNRLCSWIWKTEESRQQHVSANSSELQTSDNIQTEQLSQFLLVKLDQFLKDRELHQDLVDDEAVSLGRFIIAVSDTIHRNTKASSDVIQTILNKIFQNFHDATTRLYMSETKLHKAILLVTSMLQVIHVDVTGCQDKVNEGLDDQTKGLVTKSLSQLLSNILNLLQRKLTSHNIDGDCSQDFSYLKLCQELYKFYASTPTMKASWSQVCILLETITKANIKTIQNLQGNSNHDSQQWSTMHQSMMLLAWICGVTSGNHVTIPDSIPMMLLDAIPTFKLNIELRRPSDVLTKDGSFQDAKTSTNSWRTSVSGYLGSLWKTVAYFLEYANASHNQDGKTGIGDETTLTVTSSSKQVLESAIEALDMASCENAIPILSSIGLVISKLLAHDAQLCSHALDIVWTSLKTMWDETAFWEIYQTTMSVLMNPSLLMLPEEHPLTLKIKARIEEALKEGEFRPGIMNVVVDQLSKVWTGELTCSSGVLVYKDLIVELLLHNASIQKSHVIDYHVDAFLHHVLSDQSPLCAVSGLGRRDDADVRIIMTNILLTLSPTDPSLRDNLIEIIKALLAKDKEMSDANIKMYLNSGTHRRKHRAWQAVLVLLPLVIRDDTKGAQVEDVLRYTFKSLEDSNQLSVQNFQQWIIICILNRFPDMASLLWDELKHDPDKRLGRISLLATVAMVFTIYCVTDPKKRASSFKRAISAIFPWISTNHRQARVYAQVAVQRLWYHCVEENLELVLAERDFIEPCLDMMTTINDTLADKVRLLENYMFFDFDPIRDISMETIYLTLPKHSGISEEEWVRPEQFEKSALGMRVTKALEYCGIPLYNKDRHLAEFRPEPYNYKVSAGLHFHHRIRGEKAPTTNPTANSESNGISDGGNVQKKIIAWKIVPPDEMMMSELQQQRMMSLQKSSGGNLIVVASLIDKAPNLGGLCRTSEIFGVKKLVLGSSEIMKDKNFQNLSVSSSKWVDVEQVRPIDLKDYLQTMKRQGYTLIGVEQTANSKPLTQFTFPHDALLLLGNEKEGIPADLIQLLDVCVEIPQVGIIRSLNVHVSGALLIWEYTRQRVLCGGNTAD